MEARNEYLMIIKRGSIDDASPWNRRNASAHRAAASDAAIYFNGSAASANVLNGHEIADDLHVDIIKKHDPGSRPCPPLALAAMAHERNAWRV